MRGGDNKTCGQPQVNELHFRTLLSKIGILLILQMEDTEFDLISKAQNGECLFRCGSDRYMMKVIAPEHKAKLFGTKGGK